MKLFVNDELTVISLEPDQTLRELAQAICPPDAASLVVSVRCDGCEMSEEQLDAALEVPASEFEAIELQTQPLAALIAQNLNGAAELLELVDTSRLEAADLISAGKEQEALGKLQQLFSCWRQLQESLLLCIKACGISLEDVGRSGVAFHEMTEQIKTRLVELKSSLQAGDLVLVGDLLRFELEEPLIQWKHVIVWLVKQAKDREIGRNPLASHKKERPAHV